MAANALGETLAARDDVSNVLLLSPADDRHERDACASIVHTASDGAEATIGVIFSRTPDEWISAFRRHVGDLPSYLCLVSVGDELRSAASGQAASPISIGTATSGRITHVSSPSELSELGLRLTECIDEVTSRPGTGGALCFRGLGSLLAHNDLETVFKFLHVLVSQVSANGLTAHYHLHTTDHEGRAIGTLEPLFDGVAELSGDGAFDLTFGDS